MRTIQKILLSVFLLVFFSFRIQEPLTQEIPEAGLKISIPNTKWFLAGKQEVPNLELCVYMFLRRVDGRVNLMEEQPYIIVSVHNAAKDQPFKAFEETKFAAGGLKKLAVYTTENGKLNYPESIGFKGRGKDREGKRTIYYSVAAKNGDKVIEVHCKSKESDNFDIEPEFLQMVKTIRK